MAELCDKEVSGWIFYITLIRHLSSRGSLHLALVEQLLIYMIFTSFWSIIAFLYDVGTPSCNYLFDSIGRDLKALPMPWKIEAIIWCISLLIVRGLLALIPVIPLWRCLDILLERMRRIFLLVVFIVQLQLTFIKFCCTKCTAEPWKLLGSYKTPVSKTKPYYTYQKLQHGHIRLLRLHRDWFFRIRLELVEVPLRGAPCFEAISYTWGDQLPKEDITISDNTFSTTRTVARILKSRCHKLRLLPVPGMEFFMWIDALCINQEDSEEKNHQVPLMREIYTCAIRVIVCLGENGYARKAAWLLLELYNVSPMLSAEETMQKCLQWGADSSWLALDDLLKHPWFKRIWVVQEVAVAREVYLIYGHGMLSWDVVHWMVRRVFNYRRSTQTLSPDSTMESIVPFSFKRQLIWNVRASLYIKKSWILSEAIMYFSEHQAIDPRDKVFAILGLVTDALDMKEWIDYDKTPEQVYIKTARYILSRQEEGLALLARAGVGHVRMLNGLPSWAPDWSRPSGIFPLGISTGGAAYNASKGQKRKKEILLRTDPGAIRLLGVIVDKVKVVGENDYDVKHLMRAKTPDRQMCPWYQEYRDLQESHSPDPYLTFQPREEAFWRALIGDTANESRPASPSFASAFRSADKLLLDSSVRQDLPYGSSMADDFWDDVINFGKALTPMARGRRFCVTERGYIGWAPLYTTSGDLVCILHGSRTPFLLRSDASDQERRIYTLVGECFFHGMMDGEMLSADCPMEEFIVY